jgi:formamidopyrimidine-DNA glycosylase
VAEGDPLDHPLLASLGPEPLGDNFDAALLHAACRKRTAPIKQVIMDASVVVGVGNIYASESLFHAGIRPRTSARRVSRPRLEKLVSAIRQVLAASIEQGGTTLRDFVNSDGEPGYFRQKLFVYDRAGEPCRTCGEGIRHAVLGQRSTYWCASCQR